MSKFWQWTLVVVFLVSLSLWLTMAASVGPVGATLIVPFFSLSLLLVVWIGRLVAGGTRKLSRAVSSRRKAVDGVELPQ